MPIYAMIRSRALLKKLRKHCHSRCTQKTWHRSMEIESWSGDVEEEMGCSGKYLTAILRKYNKLLLHWMMNTTIHMPHAREHRPRNSSHMKIRITVDVTQNTKLLLCIYKHIKRFCKTTIMKSWLFVLKEIFCKIHNHVY